MPTNQELFDSLTENARLFLAGNAPILNVTTPSFIRQMDREVPSGVDIESAEAELARNEILKTAEALNGYELLNGPFINWVVSQLESGTI